MCAFFLKGAQKIATSLIECWNGSRKNMRIELKGNILLGLGNKTGNLSSPVVITFEKPDVSIPLSHV